MLDLMTDKFFGNSAEEFKIGNAQDEQKLRIIIGSYECPEANFLKTIIESLADGSFEGKDNDMTPLSKALHADICALSAKYLGGIIPCGRDERKNAKYRIDVPNKVKGYMEGFSSNFGNDTKGTAFVKDFINAVAICSGMNNSGIISTFEETFPNLNNFLSDGEVILRGMIIISPDGGELDKYYAPIEEVAVEELNNHNVIYNSAIENIRNDFEKYSSEEDNSNGRCIYTFKDLNFETMSLNLKSRNSGMVISSDNLRKSSIKAIPTEIKISIEECNYKFKCSRNKDDTEYAGHATGKEIPFKKTHIQVAAKFKVQHPAEASTRLLPAAGKAYKLLDTSSITICVNTLKTLLEIPGKMVIDEEKIHSGYGLDNRNLVLRTKDFKRDIKSDKDIKQAISENLRQAFSGKINNGDFLKFLYDMSLMNEDFPKDKYDNEIFIHSKYYNPYGKGISYIQIDCQDSTAGSCGELVENLKDFSRIMMILGEQANQLSEFLLSKFDEMNLSIEKSMSYRDIMMAILMNDIKLDPVSLTSKSEDYIQNIAKEFI